MKLPFICRECLMNPDQSSFQAHNMLIQNDDAYEFTCTLGHKSVTKLDNEKFEILFEIGVNAYRDGYTREAITSIAASLERFYEFYIRIIAYKNNIPLVIFNSVWDSSLKLSERQYGAFCLAYLFENKNSTPPTIENTKPTFRLPKKHAWKSFRNSVVHNGVIPTPDEVLAYSDIVYQHIYEIINELHTSNNTLVEAYRLSCKLGPILTAPQQKTNEDIMIDKFTSSMRLPTIIDITRVTKPYTDLAEVIKCNPEWIL